VTKDSVQLLFKLCQTGKSTTKQTKTNQNHPKNKTIKQSYHRLSQKDSKLYSVIFPGFPDILLDMLPLILINLDNISFLSSQNLDKIPLFELFKILICKNFVFISSLTGTKGKVLPWNMLLFNTKLLLHRITKSQNIRGWKGPLWVI